ncbi:MAG TPA: MarC family protein [Stellaceae bacterium]|nr:MarC family protein [Stellaceae bacterium]
MGLANAALNSFLLVYAALFPIVNPLSGAPVFLLMTRHVSRDMRHKLAAGVAVNGFVLLLASVLVGSHVLEFFGITLPVVRVAGGLVVSVMGWKLLNENVAPNDQERQSAAPPLQHEPAPDAFYPLTMPLTVGPGSMTVAITLGSQRPQAQSFGDLALIGAGAVAGLLAIAATIYVCYRFAENIETILGKTGTNVLVRLSAFILLCIGIEIIWAGVSDLAATLKS